MSRIVRIGLLGAVVGLGIGLGPGMVRGADAEGGLKAVIHVNFDGADRQGHGLKNIANILKDVPDARLEVVCHGGGIGLVQKARNEHAETVSALIAKGVRFVGCENTMRQKSIRAEDLLPGVGTVPSGAVEVIRKQQDEGFAYFRP